MQTYDVEPEVYLLMAVIHQAYEDAKDRLRGLSYGPDLEMTPQTLQDFINSPIIAWAEDNIPGVEHYVNRIRSLCKEDIHPYQLPLMEVA